MRTYGQFCPVAKASEILAERWTLLIVRELLLGSHRFNELEWGLPHIPRSLLTQRLRMLEDAGVVERKTDAKGKRQEYDLTQSGAELFDIVKGLGDWGQKWVNHNIGPGDVDPKLLVWDMHRRLDLEQVPDHRVVVQLDFHGAAKGSFWLLVERPDPSVCQTDPGFDVDLFVSADTNALHRVWMGHTTIYEAIEDGLVKFDGLPELARAFPKWLRLSFFAGVQPTPATAAD
jgi:DNA-binding HxlR family transcriptional regulator